MGWCSPHRLLVMVSLVPALAAHSAAQGTPGQLTAATPTAIARGTSGATLQLLGRNLPQGIEIHPVQVASDGSGPIAFSPVRTLSPTLALTTVSVRNDAPATSYRFVAVQPGVSTNFALLGEFTLRVYDGGSLMAPVSVTTVAVVHPLEGTLLADGENVYPRALLGTTGSGTITGFWELDGVPFERIVAQGRAGLPVTVSAHSPLPPGGIGSHELTVRLDAPQAVTSKSVRVSRVPPRPPLLRLVTPAPDSASVADAAGGGPWLRWTPLPGAIAYDVVVSPAAKDDPLAITLRTGENSLYLPVRERARLGEGRRWWTVRAVLPGASAVIVDEGWRAIELAGASPPAAAGVLAPLAPAPETIAATAHGPAISEAAGPQSGPPGQTGAATTPPGETAPKPVFDWRLDLGGDLVSHSAEGADDEYEARLPTTLTLLWEAQHASASASTDLSFLHQSDAETDIEQESRGWVAKGRLYGEPWGVLGSAGYFGPAATAGSTLLSAGLVRGGVEAGVVTPAGVLRYYGTFDDSPSGTSSSVMGGNQDVEIASWGLPFAQERASVQLVALDATDTGAPELGVAPAEARSYGVVGSVAVSDTWRVDAEGARSSLARAGGSDQDGGAYRLGAAGEVAGAALTVGVQRTESTYVNPASGTLASGGIPDRTSADLALMRQLGATTASLAYHYARSGAGLDGSTPEASQNALDAMVDTPLAETLRMAVTASYSLSQSPDALPGTPDSITAWATTASLTALWGQVVVTPTVTWQSTRNSGSPEAALADVELWNAGVSLGGPLGLAWTLAGNAAWTSNRPGAGEAADTVLVSMQPAWSHPSGFRIGPVLTGVWNEIPTVGRERTVDAQLSAAWFPPPGSRSPLGVSLAVGWRDISEPDGVPEPDGVRTGWNASVGLSLRWGRGESAAPAPAAAAAWLAPLPGSPASAKGAPRWSAR